MFIVYTLKNIVKEFINNLCAIVLLPLTNKTNI